METEISSCEKGSARRMVSSSRLDKTRVKTKLRDWSSRLTFLSAYVLPSYRTSDGGFVSQSFSCTTRWLNHGPTPTRKRSGSLDTDRNIRESERGSRCPRERVSLSERPTPVLAISIPPFYRGMNEAPRAWNICGSSVIFFAAPEEERAEVSCNGGETVVQITAV